MPLEDLIYKAAILPLAVHSVASLGTYAGIFRHSMLDNPDRSSHDIAKIAAERFKEVYKSRRFQVTAWALTTPIYAQVFYDYFIK